MNAKRKSILFLLCTLLLNGCGYKNYDECVLGEMKGQQESMQSTAVKVCERKFPYEKEIYSFRDGDFDIGWSKYLGGITIEVKSNETEYQITKAKMMFSEKACDKSQYKDFNTVFLFEFEPGMSATSYPSNKAGDFLCMKTDSVYGVIN